MLEFNAFNMVLGLFNQFVFPEAKMNIKYLRNYYRVNFYSQSNTLIPKLLNLIENYKFQDITEATFINLLASDGKSDQEIQVILNKLRDYKSYSKEQAVSFRDHLQRMCYSAYIKSMSEKYDGDEIGYVKAIKDFNYKSNYSDSLMVKNFSELEIQDLVTRYSVEGLRSRYKFINNSFTSGGWIPGQLVQIVAAPSVGKSLFLQGEAVNFIEQQKRVHYLTLGDLNELDMAIRMTCMMAKKPKWMIEKDILGNYELYRDKFSNYLGLTVVPSGYVKVTDYVEWMLQHADEFDVLMIDYDSNFAKDQSLSMYDQGGDTYDAITRLTRLGKLVFVASQPKINYFGAEYLPMDAAGESSRKQHISDVILTIGRRWESSMKMGYFNIAKNRRGDNAEQPYIGTNEGLFYECSDILYAKYKSNKTAKFLYSLAELESMDISDTLISEAIGKELDEKHHLQD